MNSWMYVCINLWLASCQKIQVSANMYVHMYVCMHVCMWVLLADTGVCRYACMYIYIYIYIYIYFMNSWMCVSMNLWLDLITDTGVLQICMYVCMHACMYVQFVSRDKDVCIKNVPGSLACMYPLVEINLTRSCLCLWTTSQLQGRLKAPDFDGRSHELSTCVCIFVCMCVCMYVCMYVCMHNISATGPAKSTILWWSISRAEYLCVYVYL
jgi:hypothetical protein